MFFVPLVLYPNIVKYTLHDDKFGVLLQGKCKKCGKDVARLVEDS